MDAVALPSSPLSPPVHVAIIMDGNGRWAKARGLPRTMGHKAGAEAVRRVVTAARELGIAYLTLFGFSSENWKRPQNEILDLMGLLRLYLKNELKTLHQNNVRLRVIGERARLSDDIVAMIERAEELTRDNSALTLCIALSYGGRQEVTLAAKSLAQEVLSGKIALEDIDEAAVAQRLFTADIPDPDLLIRTSGEKRLSNFLLWQSAYTELVFADRLWPDFSRADLEAAIVDFQGRDRRYGAAI